MRRITKNPNNAPVSLGAWRRKHPAGQYADLTDVERTDIRQTCATEQYYICAYCCKQISGTNHDTVNEHVEAQRIAPQRSLDFTNIVASCNTRKQCDAAHGSQPLALTPFMAECETEFEFTLSGKVAGKTERAKEAIRVLNLGDNEKNNRSLIQQRRQLIAAILLANGVNPDDGLEGDALIQMLIDDISQPKVDVDGNRKLAPFSPALINVLKQWLV